MSFTKLREIFPCLNIRPLTLEDFHESAGRLELLELRLKRRGYHLFDLREAQDYIFVRKGMDALRYQETLWHETFHALAGCSEYEAKALSLIAVIPLPYLDSHNWLEENPTFYARRLWQERLRLWFLWGI